MDCLTKLDIQKNQKHKNYKKYKNTKNTWVPSMSKKPQREQNITREKITKIVEKTLVPSIFHRIFR
jgi:hypothetical protein